MFFTSDLHFYHERISSFCPKTRKGSTVEEMNELIVANWNEQVSNKDTVFILGDVSWGTTEDTEKIFGRLKGHKHLILGNHDKKISKSGKFTSLFENISDYREVKIDKIDVIMFHYPIAEWNKMHYGSFHLYGHVHGSLANGGRSMDVGIDARPNGDMKLFTWDEVKERLMKEEIKPHH